MNHEFCHFFFYDLLETFDSKKKYISYTNFTQSKIVKIKNLIFQENHSDIST